MPRKAGPPSGTEQPPDDISRGLFSFGRNVVRTHPLSTDALLAVILLALSTVWLVGSVFNSPRAIAVQTALIVPLIARRLYPSAVFLAISAIAFGQYLLGFPLMGDVALLIALYTVAAHQSRIRALLAAAVIGGGAVLASVKWELAGTLPRSLLFLSGTVVAALFAGLTAASGSRYLSWMDERARRLEIERDQQAVIAAAAERTRIARELHDIIAHHLSVVVLHAAGARAAGGADPATLEEIEDSGRQALAETRRLFGVLRDPGEEAGRAPQPGIGELPALAGGLRAAGLEVSLSIDGDHGALPQAVNVSAYRIVQEALTNVLRHAGPARAEVTVGCADRAVTIEVTDDGQGRPVPLAAAGGYPAEGYGGGHGLAGMRERVALFGGDLHAGPRPDGGFAVRARLPVGEPS